jgi:hypothetical protein
MHPVTITFSNSAADKIQSLINYAPEVDILTMNIYAPNLPTVYSNVTSAGWTKPYMIGEFGPRGTWQMQPEPDRILPWTYLYQNVQTSALVEQTSTEKEETYLSAFQSHIKPNRINGCIGSMVFLWGYQKHGEVLNWYGMFDKKGYTYGVVDAMQYCWTGNYPANRAPVISDRNAMKMNNRIADEGIEVAPNSANTAFVTASDREGDVLNYEWMIMEEGTASADGSLPDAIEGLIADNTLNSIQFTAPATPGAYRLYVFVRDDLHKNAASAVIPFNVKN